MLPTPLRFHYTFNMRDIAKVFQGMLMITPSKCNNADTSIKLWIHETMRVFFDRLINQDDRDWLINLICELFQRNLGKTWKKDELFGADKIPPIFVDFLKPGAEEKPYEESTDISKVNFHSYILKITINNSFSIDFKIIR